MESNGPFKIKSSKEIYENPWITVREDAVVRPGGTDGIFGIVDVKDGTNVVVLTPRGTILLAKEYKPGYGAYTLECIGGGMDEGETPLQTAKREVLEEVGGASEKWTSLGCTVSLPTVLNFTEHLYLAEDTQIVEEQHTDAGEVIEIVEMPFEDALQKIHNGEIIHDTTVAALLKTHLLLNQ